MKRRNSQEAILSYLSQVPGADPEGLGFMIRIHEMVRQADLDFDRFLQRDGLSASRFRVLEVLFFEEGHAMTPAELADWVYLTRGAVTTVLDGLEKKGYVVRAQHPTDRRMISVTLTAEGLALVRRMLPKHFLAMSNIVRGISREDLRIVESVFEQVTTGIKGLLDESE